jgi:hypothetical protein
VTADVLKVLVLDTASCAHADSCEDIALALRSGMNLAVADIVFDRELRGRGGERLVRRGLRVERLSDVGAAVAVRREHSHLSLGDAFTVALVAANGWTLVTSSPRLVRLAEQRGIAIGDFRRPPARVSDPCGAYGLAA